MEFGARFRACGSSSKVLMAVSSEGQNKDYSPVVREIPAACDCPGKRYDPQATRFRFQGFPGFCRSLRREGGEFSMDGLVQHMSYVMLRLQAKAGV